VANGAGSRTPKRGARRLLRNAGEALRRAEARTVHVTVAAMVIAAGVSVAMGWVAGFDRMSDAIASAEPEWLALILAGMIVSYAGFSETYRSMLDPCTAERMPENLAFKLTAYGAAATSLLGGYAVDRRALRAAGASRDDAAVRVITIGAMEMAVLALAAWVSALLLLGDPHVKAAVTVPWAIGVPAGVLLAGIASVVLRPGPRRPRGALRRLYATAVEALDLIREQALHPLRHRRAWGGMVLHWGGDLAAMWAALRAVGIEPSASVLILGYATGYALTPRSLPLAGVGVTEALMPLSLHWVGLPLAESVLAVFMYRMSRLLVAVPPALAVRAEVQRLLRQTPPLR
jgi:uncharacterized membrane protein YbhN (UPF0104 family)